MIYLGESKMKISPKYLFNNITPIRKLHNNALKRFYSTTYADYHIKVVISYLVYFAIGFSCCKNATTES